MVQVLKFNHIQIQTHVLVCYHKRILLRCTCTFLVLLKICFTYLPSLWQLLWLFNSNHICFTAGWKIRGKFKTSFRNRLCCCWWRSQWKLFARERNNNKTIILITVIKLSPLALGITKALVNGLRKQSWWKLPEKIRVRIHIAFLSNQNQSKIFQNAIETSP